MKLLVETEMQLYLSLILGVLLRSLVRMTFRPLIPPVLADILGHRACLESSAQRKVAWLRRFSKADSSVLQALSQAVQRLCCLHCWNSEVHFNFPLNMFQYVLEVLCEYKRFQLIQLPAVKTKLATGLISWLIGSAGQLRRWQWNDIQRRLYNNWQ